MHDEIELHAVNLKYFVQNLEDFRTILQKVLGTTVQTLDFMTIWSPGFVKPCFSLKYFMILVSITNFTQYDSLYTQLTLFFRKVLSKWV
jgi:hypothetical protein